MSTTAIAFASFLSQLSAAPASDELIPQQAQPAAYRVAYGDSLVDFQLKNGRIDTGSVCKSPPGETRASCLHEARNLFKDTCEHLLSRPTLRWQQKQRLDGFCNVHLDMPGQNASIHTIKEQKPDAGFLARQQCSDFTLRAQRTGSGIHEQKRAQACSKARRLSALERQEKQLARN